jgi:hypothetical protein
MLAFVGVVRGLLGIVETCSGCWEVVSVCWGCSGSWGLLGIVLWAVGDCSVFMLG